MTEFFEITDHLGRTTGKKKKREEVHRDGIGIDPPTCT